MTFIVYPLVFYFIWVSLYYTINFVISADRIKKRNYDNMYILYNKKPWAKKLLNTFGEGFAPVMFISIHFSFFFICHLGSISCFFYETFHTFCIVFWLTWSVWNSSCFYMDYFAKKYNASLERLEQVEQQLKEEA